MFIKYSQNRKIVLLQSAALFYEKKTLFELQLVNTTRRLYHKKLLTEYHQVNHIPVDV